MEPIKITTKQNKEHITKLIDLLYNEVISVGGDGDAIWYTRFYDLNDIKALVKEYNDINKIDWEIEEDAPGVISWGKYQEFVIITNDINCFNNSPDDFTQMKIRY